MIEIVKIRHAWPEGKNFVIDRPNGVENDYIFLMFHTPIEIMYGGGMITTSPGAFILYGLHTPQYFCADGENAIIHDWMHLRGDVPELMKSCGLSFDTLYYPPNTRYITDTVFTLESEHAGTRRHFAEICDSTLHTLFYRISRAVYDGEREVSRDSETVKRVKAFRTAMFSDVARQWTVSDMAAAASLSESRFYALYKDLFGISPTSDLIGARVEKARHCLQSGDYTVGKAAAEVGYNNVFHFIRQFKAATGKTPGEFIPKSGAAVKR